MFTSQAVPHFTAHEAHHAQDIQNPNGPFAAGVAAFVAAWSIDGALERVAHPHPGWAAEPGFAPQTQAGVSPVPVHRTPVAGAVGGWACAYPRGPCLRQGL